MSGSAVGLIIGIPVGVLLAGDFGFRSPFYFFGVMMALTFLLVALGQVGFALGAMVAGYTRVPQPAVKRRRSRLTVNRAIAGYAVMLRRPEIAFAALAFFMVRSGSPNRDAIDLQLKATRSGSPSSWSTSPPGWRPSTTPPPNRSRRCSWWRGLPTSSRVPRRAGSEGYGDYMSDRVGRKVMVISSCLGLSVVMLATVPLITSFWVAYPLSIGAPQTSASSRMGWMRESARTP